MLAKTELKVTLVVPRCPPKLAEVIREREVLRVDMWLGRQLQWWTLSRWTKVPAWFIYFISQDEQTLKKWDYETASKAIMESFYCPTVRFWMKFLIASGLPSFRALIGIVDESQDATNTQLSHIQRVSCRVDLELTWINTQVVWSELAKILVSGLGWTHESQLQLNTGDVVGLKARSRTNIDPIIPRRRDIWWFWCVLFFRI